MNKTMASPKFDVKHIPFLRRYPRELWIFALCVMLLTSIPYLVAFQSQGDEWRFTGFLFAVEDGNTYLAKMLRGAAGDWLFRTPYTAQPQQGVFALIAYLLLGKLTLPPHLHAQMIVLYHLFRIGAGMLAVLATYDFLALYVRGARWRRWGVALATLGGGLGWLLIVLGEGSWLGSLPLDLYSPETFGFLALYGLPHLALARAFFLWGWAAFFEPEAWPLARYPGLLTGLLWLAMGMLQPLTVALAGGVSGAFVMLLAVRQFGLGRRRGGAPWGEWRAWFVRSFWAVLICAPIAIYTFFAFRSDPIMQAYTAQNQILSPHPLHYLAAYGLVIGFAIAGLAKLLRSGSLRGWLPLAWSLILPILLYIPYPLQRRLAEGYWVVLTTLTMVYLETAQTRLAAWSKYVLALTLPTTLILLAGGIQVALHPAEPIFRQASEAMAFDFIAKNADSETVVVAAYETSNALPSWAPVFVLIGHGPESVGLDELAPRVTSFYKEGTPDEERLALLAEFGVDYVFWGPRERTLGTWKPDRAYYLEFEYLREGYWVFSVDLPE